MSFRQQFARFAELFRRRSAAARELGEEMRGHVEMETQENLAAGMPPEEARRAAHRAFGNVTLAAEDSRAAWRFEGLDSVVQDLRYGARMLAKSPGFSAVAIVTLTLGIGANATIFSFVDAFFYRPLPARDPYRLVTVNASVNGQPRWGFSYPEYAYFRDHARSFEALAAHYSTAPFNVTAHGSSREEEGAVVSANYFSLLGIRPFMGRFFLPQEDAVPDRDSVAVLSYAYWENRLGGDPGIVGKVIRINATPFTIVGIAPQNFRGVQQGTDNAIWIPTMMLRVGYRWHDCFQTRCGVLTPLGRLAPGRTQAEAQAELTGLYNQLQSTYPVAEPGRGVMVAPALGLLDSFSRSSYATQMRLLTGVAGLLLLIACANLAGLMLARGSARGKEMAVRLAVGASRARLIRQLLMESLLLAIPGGAFGLLVSSWAKDWLAGYYTMGGEGPGGTYSLSLDPLVLAYSVAMAVLTGLLFGLAPAIQASRQDLKLVLKDAGTTSVARRSFGRNALVVGQVALSLGLLVSAGLLLRSAAQIRGGANFDPNHVALLRLRPLLVGYGPDKAQAFTREVVRRFEALPGVESVSLTKGQGLTWGSNDEMPVRLPGQEFARLEDVPRIDYQEVAPRFFETLRIPLLQGREFLPADQPGSLRVAIVNETLARRLWPGRSAVGRNLLIHEQTYQVVGVAKDARFRSAIDPPSPFLYLPFWQNDIAPQVDARFCVRVAGNASGMIPALHHAVEAVDANVPISEEMAMSEQVEGVYMTVFLTSSVLLSASALALFLSAIGLYGALSFAVGQRRSEIGIRMALGAERIDILRMVLAQGLRLASAGVVLGIGGALVLSRALAHFLYGVSSSDPWTFAGVVFLIVAVAALASLIPARRATRVDPLVALRYE